MLPTSITEGVTDGKSLVYLIHFDRPYKHAKHYMGTTIDLGTRLHQHRMGTRYGGARLMEVIIEAGISWRVSIVWPGGRELERRLKRWCNHSRLCPICKASKNKKKLLALKKYQTNERILTHAV